MVIFRLIGVVLIFVAIMLFGADVVTTLEKGGALWSGELTMRSLDQVLVLLHWDIKSWIEQTLPAPVSDWLVTALSWPSWADLGVPGVVFFIIGGTGE